MSAENSDQTDTTEKKQLIIDTAKKLFLEKGFANTSLNLIIKSAGISKGLIYYHFENKDELGIKVLESVLNDEIKDFDSFGQLINSISDKSIILSKLDEYLDHLFSTTMQDYSTMPVIIDLLLNLKSKESKLKVREIYVNYIDKIANFLKLLEIEKPTLNAKLIVSILDGIMYLNMALDETLTQSESKHVIHALKCMVGLEERK